MNNYWMTRRKNRHALFWGSIKFLRSYGWTQYVVNIDGWIIDVYYWGNGVVEAQLPKPGSKFDMNDIIAIRLL
jgi:hypothetical protein